MYLPFTRSGTIGTSAQESAEERVPLDWSTAVSGPAGQEITTLFWERAIRNWVVGALFAETTTSKKLLLAVFPFGSITVNVMVELPKTLKTGVRVTVRLLPLPLKLMFASARS